MTTRPDWLDGFRVEVPARIPWSAIAGHATAKAALQGLVARYKVAYASPGSGGPDGSATSEAVRDAARSSLVAGAVIRGRPGSGKTTLLRITASWLDGAELYLLGALPTRRWTELAMWLAGRPDESSEPLLLLALDEVDAWASRGPTGGLAPERQPELLAALQAIDGLATGSRGTASRRVLWLAATSSAHRGIDEALTRPGRLSIRIELKGLAVDELAALARTTIGPLLDPTVRVERLMPLLGGAATGAEAIDAARIAIGYALTADSARPVVTESMLRRAILDGSYVAPPVEWDRGRVAAHEAGHVIAARYAAVRLPISQIVLHEPGSTGRGGRQGLVRYEAPNTLTTLVARSIAVGAFGGMVAEELLLPAEQGIALASDHDIDVVSSMVSSLYRSGLLPGYAPVMYRAESDPAYLAAAGVWANGCREEARSILLAHLGELRVLQNRLRAGSGELDAAELEALLAGELAA